MKAIMFIMLSLLYGCEIQYNKVEELDSAKEIVCNLSYSKVPIKYDRKDYYIVENILLIKDSNFYINIFECHDIKKK